MGGVGISREGGNWWLIRLLAPGASTLYWSKLAAALLAPCLIAALAGVALVYVTDLALYPLLPTLLLMWAMAVGVVAFELLLDILVPNFALKIEFGGSRKAQAGIGKLLTVTFAAMLYAAVLGSLLYLPEMREGFPWLPRSATWRQVADLAPALLWVALTVLVSASWGQRRLTRLLASAGDEAE